MNIVIWRHADAAAGSPDAARPVTERGQRQAKVVAEWLRLHLPKPYRVIGSPAVGARDTAAALTRVYEERAELGYGLDSATGQAVLDAAGWPGGHDTVIFVLETTRTKADRDRDKRMGMGMAGYQMKLELVSPYKER